MLEGGLPVAIEKVNQDWQATMSHIDFHRENLLPLLSGLHQGNLLPALLFNFSRDNVEHLGQHLVEQLTKGEERYKATNKHWKTKLEEWNKWKDDEPARRKAEEKKLKGITIAALIVSGLSLIGAFMSGIGLLGGIVGAILGFVAMKKNPEAKPWPLIAALAGVVATVISIVVIVILLVSWIPYLIAIGQM